MTYIKSSHRKHDLHQKSLTNSVFRLTQQVPAVEAESEEFACVRRWHDVAAGARVSSSPRQCSSISRSFTTGGGATVRSACSPRSSTRESITNHLSWRDSSKPTPRNRGNITFLKHNSECYSVRPLTAGRGHPRRAVDKSVASGAITVGYARRHRGCLRWVRSTRSRRFNPLPSGIST
jgi:hypothetical protein